MIPDLPLPAPATDAALIQSFLANRDEPCPNCNYNFRGLMGNQCPECGHRIRLCVLRDIPAIPRFIYRFAIGTLVLLCTTSARWLFGFTRTIFLSGIPRMHVALLMLELGVEAVLAASVLGIGLIRNRTRGYANGALTIIGGCIGVQFLASIIAFVREVGRATGLW